MNRRENRTRNVQGRIAEIKKLSNPNIDTDMQIIQKTMFNTLWKDNTEIGDIEMGKHDDIFNEEDKKEVIEMIEQDNFEMRKQRILSGIKKDIKCNYKKYKEIFGSADKKVA